MAEYASGQRQQVHQQERAERWRFRQQHIKDGGGSGDVQRGDDQLQERQASTGQAQGAAADLDQQVVRVGLFRQATAINPDAQRGRQQQHDAGNRPQQALRHMQGSGRGGQVAQGGQGRQRRQGAAQGEAGEHSHAGDFRSPDAMARI